MANKQPRYKTTKVTVDGIELDIDGYAMDDVELFDMLDRLDPEDPNILRIIPRILRAMFGPKGMQTVMDHLRNAKTGRVGFEAAADFVAKTMGALDPNS